MAADLTPALMNVCTTILMGSVSAAVIYLTAKFSLSHQKSAGQSQMFTSISKQWGDIYLDRNKLLAMPPKNYTYFATTYPNYVDFLASDEWKLYRPILAFYEAIGVLLYRKDISDHDLFVLVTVDVFHRTDNAEHQRIDEGVIYSKLKGPIEYLRKKYRSDIYFYYDNFLLERFKKRHIPTPQPIYS